VNAHSISMIGISITTDTSKAAPIRATAVAMTPTEYCLIRLSIMKFHTGSR
jgi:hypothetical protein